MNIAEFECIVDPRVYIDSSSVPPDGSFVSPKTLNCK